MDVDKWLDQLATKPPGWWWRRRGSVLLDLLDGLPSTSRFRGAIVNDPNGIEELAMRVAASEDEWSPPYQEWSAGMALGADIHDVVVLLLRLVGSALGAEMPELKSFPRPNTALTKALKQAEEALDEAQAAQANDLAHLVTPHAFTD